MGTAAKKELVATLTRGGGKESWKRAVIIYFYNIINSINEINLLKCPEFLVQFLAAELGR